MNLTELFPIFRAIQENEGQAFVVGGFVRDRILGLPNKDVDIEVYGLCLDALRMILSSFGTLNEVGKSFGVLKLRFGNQDIDFSLPRRDSKTGTGHRGFDVCFDETLSPEEASARRDFTINTLFLNPLTGAVKDPWNGVPDLKNKVIRHTSSAFSEDPLRVLRATQFAGRFDMVLHPQTAELCKSLLPEFKTLPVERIWEEFKKWATKSVKPSRGIQVLLDSGWITQFPELNALWGLKQQKEYHPEIDCLLHTMHCLDHSVEVATRDALSEDQRLVLSLAVLCHDFGKATTTVVDGDKITTHGHDTEGEAPTRSFLARIGCPLEIIEKVVVLVVNHMFQVSIQHASATVVRRFANRLGDHVCIQDWLRVVECDHSGRPPLPKGVPEMAQKIWDKSLELNLERNRPKPILMGRHLLELLDMQPGKEFGVLLRRAFEAQLEGVFTDLKGAIQWLQEKG